MPDWVLVAVGAALLGVTLFDFLKTTIGMAGMGPVAGRVALWLWLAARRLLPGLHRRLRWSFEDVVGPGILCGIASTWIVLTWAGYALMFAPGAALSMPDGEGVPDAAVISFAGASISTVGARLADPANAGWDVLSAVAAVHGMVMLTLSVSFIMTVWQATQQARALALRVAALEGVAPRLPDDALAGELESLAPDFAELVVAIRATPVVGFFATERTEMNLPLATLSLCALLRRVGERPESPALGALRIALHALAATAGPGEGAPKGVAGARQWAESRRLVA